MKLRLLKPWADHAAGAAVDVPDAPAAGLVNASVAEPAGAARPSTAAEITPDEAQDAAGADADLAALISVWPLLEDAERQCLGAYARGRLRTD